MNEQDAKSFFLEMDKIFKKMNVKYFLFLGTLLGEIREKRFIPVDKDLDIGIFQEEFDKVYKDLIKEFKIKEFKVQLKYHNKEAREKNIISGFKIAKHFNSEIHCDVCCFKKIKKWSYYPRNKIAELLVYPAKELENLKKIEFYGRQVLVPYNSELFLELTYGKDWRIPHTKFKASFFHCGRKPLNGNEFWWVNPSTIIYTYGVFDLLHPGHIKLLEKAKKLGDYLIVGIVGDKAVSELKGKDRPIQLAKDRLFIIENLKCVDKVMHQKTYNPSKNLLLLEQKHMKVNILTKGDDWEKIPGEELIKKLGGKLIKLPYSKKFSTTSMVKKIKGDK